MNVELEFDALDAFLIDNRTEVRQEEIAFEVQNQDDASLAAGVTAIQQEGQNGVKSVSYSVTFVKGKELRRTVVSETVMTPAIPQTVSIGIASESPSDEVPACHLPPPSE